MATPAAQAFRPGDTRERNGWIYERQADGTWHPVRPASTVGSAAPTVTALTPPDPTRQAAEARAESAEARAQRAEQRAEASAAREQQQATEGTEAERTAAFLATRVAGGIQDLDRALAADPNAAQPSVGGALAGIFGSEARNWANSPARRQVEAAQMDILDAALTLGTGAAYTREQLEGYRQSYFPALTDDPASIAAKRQRLLRLLESARVKAGRAAPQIDQALGALRAQESQGGPSVVASMVAPAVAAATDAPSPGGPDGPGILPPGTGPGVGGVPWAHNLPDGAQNPLTAEQQAAYDAFNRANPHATEEQLTQFFQGIGFNLRNARGIVEMRERGAGVQPGAEAQYRPPDISDARGEPAANLTPEQQQASRDREMVDAIARGGADVLSLGLADEFAAVGDTLFSGGTMAENLARERTIDSYDRTNHPYARTGGQLAAGFALPFRAATLGGRIAESGAFGAGYGFGSGEGAERFPSALSGGIVGAAVPPVFDVAGAAAGRVRSAFVPTITPEMQAVARAAQEEGVTASRPIIDPASRTRAARLEASVGGNRPVREGFAATEAGIDERAQQLARGGTANERGVMGQRIQAAADRHHGAEGARIRSIYREAENAAPGATVEGREAVTSLDEHLARLRENPRANAPLIRLLEDYRADFVDEAGNLIPKSIGAIRDLRTNMRGRINEANLATSNVERMIDDALDGARRDIQRDLRDVRGGDEALRLYNRADRQWRARAENRRQVVERVVGPADNRISGSAVMDRVRAMAKGDAPRLRRLWGMLNEEEQRDAAATIAAAAGRKSPEDPFSPAQFMAWARTIEPSARRVVFGDEGARSIENLTLLARELKAARGELNNSRSGMVQNWGQFLRQFSSGGIFGTIAGVATDASAMSTGATGVALGALSAGIGAGMRRLSARSLMSPDLSRWLRDAPRATTAGAIREHIQQLSLVASRDPAIAQEVTGLQQWLRQAVNDNFERQAAASEPDQEQRRQGP